jgi:cell division protease FtsH
VDVHERDDGAVGAAVQRAVRTDPRPVPALGPILDLRLHHRAGLRGLRDPGLQIWRVELERDAPDRLPHGRRRQVQERARLRREAPDAAIRVEYDDGDLDGLEEVHEIGVRELQLLVAAVELVVHRRELLVRRLELLLGRLELLVHALELLVDRDELRVRGRELVVRAVVLLEEGVEELLGRGQLLLEPEERGRVLPRPAPAALRWLRALALRLLGGALLEEDHERSLVAVAGNLRWQDDDVARAPGAVHLDPRLPHGRGGPPRLGEREPERAPKPEARHPEDVGLRLSRRKLEVGPGAPAKLDDLQPLTDDHPGRPVPRQDQVVHLLRQGQSRPPCRLGGTRAPRIAARSNGHAAARARRGTCRGSAARLAARSIRVESGPGAAHATGSLRNLRATLEEMSSWPSCRDRERRSRAPEEPMNKKARFNLVYVFIAVSGVLLAHDLWTRSQGVAVIPYSQFQQLLAQGKVQEVVIDADSIQGVLKEPLQGAPYEGRSRFLTTQVRPDLAATLEKYGVTFAGRVESPWLHTILSWVIPVALFGAMWMFLARRVGGPGGPGAGLMSVGKSKAKIYVETGVPVRFADVAGVDEAKAELEEVVSFLKDPKSYGRLGARMPKGVLLVGPPGTGKTLLARAVAGEAAVAFFSISGSEFVEMFVGVGAARVRDLFQQARLKAPCVIFIDELDALGRARGAYPGMGGHDEKEQTLNQLLAELDGFDPTTGIVLLGATNRPEVLDAALLRAGRFDRQVLVDRPDRIGRAQILAIHVKKVVLAPDVKLEEVAALTPGFTGADLANLVNEAALVATRRVADQVSTGDFTAAIERIVAGLEKRNRLLNPMERRVVAHHEMGHAIVAAAQAGCDPVHKISIIPRGIGALGYTIQRPTEDRYLMTREELAAKMAVLLGGRTAEEVIFGHLSTGASDDLSKVTDIARSMVTRYGMYPDLGPLAYESEPSGFLAGIPQAQHRLYSEQTAREIDVAIRGLVEAAQAQARRILEDNRGLLEEGAEQLLAKETLADAELQALLRRVVMSAHEPSAVCAMA